MSAPTCMCVVGFYPVSDEWLAMFAVWNACDRASVPVPAEVVKFFNGEKPDDSSGPPVALTCKAWRWQGKSTAEGFEIGMNEIPSGLEKIRFFCEW